MIQDVYQAESMAPPETRRSADRNLGAPLLCGQGYPKISYPRGASSQKRITITIITDRSSGTPKKPRVHGCYSSFLQQPNTVVRGAIVVPAEPQEYNQKIIEQKNKDENTPSDLPQLLSFLFRGYSTLHTCHHVDMSK